MCLTLLRFIRAGIICNARRIIGPGGATSAPTPPAPPHSLLSIRITTTLSSIVTHSPSSSSIDNSKVYASHLSALFQDITSLILSVPTYIFNLKSAACSRLCCKRIQLTLPPKSTVSHPCPDYLHKFCNGKSRLL